MQMSGEGKKDRGDNVIEASRKDSSFFPQATQAEPERATMDAVRKLLSVSLAQHKSHFAEIRDRKMDTFNKFLRVIMDSTNEWLSHKQEYPGAQGQHPLHPA